MFFQHRCSRHAARSVKQNEVLLLCTCTVRHKHLNSTILQSPLLLNYNTDKKQTEVLCNRKKTFGLHTKSQGCYNSGLKLIFWIVRPCECGSSWEEAFSQSYDCNELTDREKEKEREKRERDWRERPDSINCLCEEVRRGGRVRVMKMNHYPLEN